MLNLRSDSSFQVLDYKKKQVHLFENGMLIVWHKKLTSRFHHRENCNLIS